MAVVDKKAKAVDKRGPDHKRPGGSPKKRARKELKAIASAAADKIYAGENLTYAPAHPILSIQSQWELTRPAAPPIDHPEARLAVIEMSVAGIPRERIAEYLGVTVAELTSRFGHEINTATDEVVSRVAMSLAQKAIAGDTHAQIAFLRHRGGEVWREKKEVAVTGKDGGAVQVEVKNRMVDKLLELVARRETSPDLIDVTPEPAGK